MSVPIPAHRPLDGLLVVDLSRYLPGPLVSRLLADLGARVIKVEEPSLGDPCRQAPPLLEGRGSLATLLLQGHASVALDLKKDKARDALEDLLLSADVLVESFRPGALAAFGLAPERLRELFPQLVICSVTGFGQDGPHAFRAGHDLTYQALAGSLAGGTGMPAIQVADMVGGWSGALAVTSALLRRKTTKTGCWIDLALLDAAGHSALTAWAAEADFAKGVGEPLPLTGAFPCYDLYRTRDDGTLALAALEPKFWKSFCLALGEKDLVRHQFSNDVTTRERVAEIVRRKSRAEWAAFMAEHDLPGEPVLALSEALEQAQVRHRDLARRGDDGLLRLGFPALFDGQRPRVDAPLPELGEQTHEVLNELGAATELTAGARRRGGIGRRFSLKRWALRLVTEVAQARQKRANS